MRKSLLFVLAAALGALFVPAAGAGRQGSPVSVGYSGADAAAPVAASAARLAVAPREVKVFLVALDDAGKKGRKIGCDDSLVPVTRTVRAGREPLRAALEELLSLPHEYEGGLSNFWRGERLRLRGVSVRRGTATIRIAGTLLVAGVCDVPRIEEQIKETARQFPGVRRVRVFVNNRPLSEAIS